WSGKTIPPTPLQPLLVLCPSHQVLHGTRRRHRRSATPPSPRRHLVPRHRLRRWLPAPPHAVSTPPTSASSTARPTSTSWCPSSTSGPGKSTSPPAPTTGCHKR